MDSHFSCILTGPFSISVERQVPPCSLLLLAKVCLNAPLHHFPGSKDRHFPGLLEVFVGIRLRSVGGLRPRDCSSHADVHGCARWVLPSARPSFADCKCLPVQGLAIHSPWLMLKAFSRIGGCNHRPQVFAATFERHSFNQTSMTYILHTKHQSEASTLPSKKRQGKMNHAADPHQFCQIMSNPHT